MDRLPVFKALGDNTRYAIYLEIARSAGPLSTGDIAESLELHPNTVRPHLERMRDVGLLEVTVDSRGAVGRPQHRYSLSAEAPSLGLEPAAFRLLARLLAGVASAGHPDPDAVAAMARPRGREDGQSWRKGRSCIDALMAEQTAMGFDPAHGEDGVTTSIAFTHCPFREVAEQFPDVVCQLHRGLVEGVVEEVGGMQVTRFATLADRDPCRVELASR